MTAKKTRESYERKLGEALHHVRRHLARMRAEELSKVLPEGTTISTADALHALDAFGQEGVSRAAEYLGISQPGLTLALGKLVSEGYVRQESRTGPARTRVVTLTKKGREVVEAREVGERMVAKRILGMAEAEELRPFYDVLMRLAYGSSAPLPRPRHEGT